MRLDSIRKLACLCRSSICSLLASTSPPLTFSVALCPQTNIVVALILELLCTLALLSVGTSLMFLLPPPILLFQGALLCQRLGQAPLFDLPPPSLFCLAVLLSLLCLRVASVFLHLHLLVREMLCAAHSLNVLRPLRFLCQQGEPP